MSTYLIKTNSLCWDGLSKYQQAIGLSKVDPHHVIYYNKVILTKVNSENCNLKAAFPRRGWLKDKRLRIPKNPVLNRARSLVGNVSVQEVYGVRSHTLTAKLSSVLV